MKKLFLFFALLLATQGVRASIPAPRADNGDVLPTIDWVGADVCVIDAVATTAPLVCSSASVVIYGIIASNAAIGDYATFRSTNLAATTIVSTSAIVYVSTNGFNAFGAGAGLASSFVYKFPVPIKMTNGLNVKLSATVAAPGNWTVLYRKVRASE